MDAIGWATLLNRDDNVRVLSALREGSPDSIYLNLSSHITPELR